MPPISRRRVLLALSSTALSACAPPLRLAQTDPLPPAEGGIGGTGVVGVLTEFGSLIVNGLRLRTDAATRYEDAFGALDPSRLSVGHALTVQTRDRRTSETVADMLALRVRVDHPAVGPAAPSAIGDFAVNGAPVVLAPGAPAAARLGDRVAVSGLWRDGVIVASRVDPVPPGPDALSGAFEADGPADGRIGPTRVVLSGGPRPAFGGFATLLGRSRDGLFFADAIAEGRFDPTVGPLDRLSIEGYLEPIAAAPFWRVAGLGHSFAPDARVAAFSTGRAVLLGGYDGLFAPEAGLALPEDGAARRRMLRDVLDGRASMVEIL